MQFKFVKKKKKKKKMLQLEIVACFYSLVCCISFDRLLELADSMIIRRKIKMRETKKQKSESANSSYTLLLSVTSIPLQTNQSIQLYRLQCNLISRTCFQLPFAIFLFEWQIHMKKKYASINWMHAFITNTWILNQF